MAEWNIVATRDDAVNRTDPPKLKPFLERLRRRYNRPGFIASDPLVIPHSYSQPADQEVAAFITAAFSYGRVDQIIKSSRSVLGALGDSPAETLRRASPRDLRDRLEGRYHRLANDRDIALMCASLGRALRESGSLGADFEHFGMAVAPGKSPDLMPALAAWLGRLREIDAQEIYGAPLPPRRAGFWHLLPNPAGTSACKRLQMFLRWMIRRADGIDMGLWTFASPARLLMPVDTHILRLSHHLGLTTRRAADLKTAREITASLKQLAPRDPTKYDFAISRLGILNECPSRERLELCAACGLAPVCLRRRELLGARDLA